MTDSINILRAYRNRLEELRRREQKSLSEVDFRLFASRFDHLIEKTQRDIVALEPKLSALVSDSASHWFGTGCIGRSMHSGTCSVLVRFPAVPEPYFVSGIASFGGFERKAGRLFSDTFEVENVAHGPAASAAS